MKRVDAVILAGGYGRRILKVTKNKIPKPLLKINKKPFLDYLIQNLSKYNINKIYIIAGHKGLLIKKKYQDKYQNLVQVECIVEKKALGTAYALNYIKNKIKNDFILINGDTFVDFNLNYFFKKKINKFFIGCMVLTKKFKNSLTNNLLNLDIDANERIVFSNKNKFISSGVIFLRKKILKLINKKNFSLENDILNKLIIEKKLKGIEHKGLFIDIGTPKNFLLAKKIIKKKTYRPAVFFDRDGVINYDHGYTHKIRDFKFKPQIIKTLKFFSNKNFYIFIVTNQSGIARGYYGTEDFIKLQEYMKKELSIKNIFINDVVYCPHYKAGIIKKFSINCNCRKPKTGMVKYLKENWTINIKKSLFIGDNITDKMCAQRSNINFIFYNNNLYKNIKKYIKIQKI
jgi:D-glycero-D-manno-heptose 1,7-bisphosphate phosphatase